MSNSRNKMYHLLIPLTTETVNSVAPDERAHNETPHLAQCCLPYGV